MKGIKIGNIQLGDGRTFIIAEAGINHNGDLQKAKKLVDAAKAAGADAVKFQTFRAEDIVTESAERAEYQKRNVGGEETQFEMLKRLEMSERDFEELKKHCDAKGIMFLSTPHSSFADVDLLDSLGVPAFKIGSGDLTNLPFIEHIAKKGKPVFLSTGMATIEEVKEAVDFFRKHNEQLVVNQCTTSYPCQADEANLRAMLTIGRECNVAVGFSDHTMGLDAAILAVSMGACVIEKHFTLDRKMEGPDHNASLEPHELNEMVKRIRAAEKNPDEFSKLVDNIEDKEKILGSSEKKPIDSEKEIMKMVRKSLVAGMDIKKGERLTKDNVTTKRPGTGLAPKYYWDILGKKTRRDIKKDTLLDWNMAE